MEAITKGWKEGYNIPILGHGIRKVYTYLAFFVGDDPELQQKSGMMQAPTFACRSCLYPTNQIVMCNVENHPPRKLGDFLAIQAKAIEAKLAWFQGAPRSTNTHAGVSVLNEVTSEGYHVLPLNPFHHVVMLDGRDILNGGSPPDAFHVLQAGLLNSLKSWVIRVVVQFNKSSDARYKDISLALFDERFVSLGKEGYCEIPHTPFEHMPKGIVRLVTETVQGKTNRATGSAGGMRSSYAIMYSLMFILILQGDDQIVSNDNEYIFRMERKEEIPQVGVLGTGSNPAKRKKQYRTVYKEIKTGNVKHKLLMACSAGLDIFYECQRIVWTKQLQEQFRL